jgi:hypothetical protein
MFQTTNQMGFVNQHTELGGPSIKDPNALSPISSSFAS